MKWRKQSTLALILETLSICYPPTNFLSHSLYMILYIRDSSTTSITTKVIANTTTKTTRPPISSVWFIQRDTANSSFSLSIWWLETIFGDGRKIEWVHKRTTNSWNKKKLTIAKTYCFLELFNEIYWQIESEIGVGNVAKQK